MRDILMTSLVISFCAATAFAKEASDCFGRTYDLAHLKANPEQNARDIRAKLTTIEETGVSAIHMRILFRDDPREFTAYPACYMEDGSCGIDCDGGHVKPELMEDGRLRLTTGHLRAETFETLPGDDDEGGCAGPVTRNIADGPGYSDGMDKPTVFILYPRDSRECGWEDGDG
ncbi:hypothetical protein SAMN05421772_113118 [Paracoccus saliphilus]|uniref:Uncharacterized protein n=2 Tax=Paracoccus saliphilus TaxID=405559 RepID=A0AA45W6S4_9RHOB|nr:hypothetical protein SAMN05421772_113118 [Paracoccus saliphilus]